MNVVDHANYSRLFCAKYDGGASYRVLSRPVAASCSLIDDHNGGILPGVLPTEVTSCSQAHPHGIEISRRYDIDESSKVLVFGTDFALRGQAPSAISFQRKVISHSRAFNAGDGGNTVHNLAENGGTLYVVLAVVIVVVNLDGSGAAWLKSQVNIHYAQKAAQQQSCASQQHAGQCDLRDNQDCPQAVLLSPFTHSCAAILERFLQISAGRLEPGRKAKKDRGHHCDQQRPGKRGAIHLDSVQQGKCD